jgi:hypothetical protein
MFYFEAVELSSVGFPCQIKTRNHCACWSAFTKFHKRPNGFGFTLDNCFNTGIWQVANPTRYAAALRFAFGFQPEEHALNSTAYKYVRSDFHAPFAFPISSLHACNVSERFKSFHFNPPPSPAQACRSRVHVKST